MSDAQTLYVLDGSYYIFRAFHAIRSLSNSRGMPTNGLYAFTNMLLNVIRDHRPDYLAVTFDPPGGSFRQELDPNYKANREDPPEDLVPQLPVFRDIVRALQIPILEVPGFEADDVIGTLVRRAEREGMDLVILSGDKDLYQLLDEQTVMLDSMRDRRIDLEEVMRRFQVAPDRVPDVLGLAGDTSDNIPGCPGVGEKTAGNLISEFGSMEELFENLDKVRGPKRRENLEAFREQAFRSRELATIRTDVPLEVDLGALRVEAPDFQAFDELCAHLEFRRFPEQLRDLFTDAAESAVAEKVERSEYELVDSRERLAEVIAQIRAAGVLSVDLETTSVDALEAEIVGWALSWRPGVAVYVPTGHRDLMDAMRQLPATEVLESLRPLLEDPDLPKVGQHLKYEVTIFNRHGISLRGIRTDTMLAAYLLDPNRRRYGLDALAMDRFGYRMIAYEEVAGRGREQKSFEEVPIEAAVAYAAEDADLTLRLSEVFEAELREQEMESLLREVEIPLTLVLARMEAHGIRVDTAFLRTLGGEFEERLSALEAEIHELAGGPFTINSPKQLAEILFEKLELPVQKRGKSGPSTDQSVLEVLAPLHPLPERILAWRQLAKLKSTYVDTLPALVRADTGRVHTDFNQAVAATGRLSSSNPNLQNIPIRSEEGRRIREAFIPEEGWSLFAADYSQIELRILAHLSEEPVLLDAFAAGEDVHRRTAAEVFGVDSAQVSPQQRAMAKTINFGVIYGMGARRLAAELGLSHTEAESFIARYFERIGRVKPFFEGLVEVARERGYALTMLGRRRPIPELAQGRGRSAALGERLAVNTPIQGSAADLIKQAMVRIQAELDAEGLRSRMLLQVHDELVFEVPPQEKETLRKLVHNAMEGVWKLRVPLVVESSFGENWATLK